MDTGNRDLILERLRLFLLKSSQMENALTSQFLKQSDDSRDFLHLFDHLEGISFFLKNSDFQIVSANANFYSRLGFTSEDEIIGKDDFELFPRPLAGKFRRDDEQVMRTGQEMLRMVELFLNRHGLPDWFLTNKMAVRNRKGAPVGIMGTVERYDQKLGLGSGDSAIARAVEAMLEHPGEIESISEFAAQLGMSHRHFDRRFKEVTGLTPKQFLGRSRIQQACRILQRSNTPLSTLAVELGYCDQSAFTAQFRTRMGMTPLKYRKQFGGKTG